MHNDKHKVSAFTIINSVINDKRLTKDEQLEIFIRIAMEALKQATYVHITNPKEEEKEDPLDGVCCPSCCMSLYLRKDEGNDVYLCKDCNAIFREFIDPKSERKLFTTTEIINKLLKRVFELENEIYRISQFKGKD